MCKRLEFIDGEPIFKAQGELVQDERPLLNGDGPLLADVFMS